MKKIINLFWYAVYGIKIAYLLIRHPRQTVNKYFGFLIPFFAYIGVGTVLFFAAFGLFDRAKSGIMLMEYQIKQNYGRTIIVFPAKAGNDEEPDNQATPDVPEDRIVDDRDQDIDRIVRAVYQLESSSGKNDGCKRKGMFNGYGFMQSTYHWKCFESHEEVENLVSLWFVKELETHSLPASLCRYNTGIYSETCPYYEKYLSIMDRI